MGVRSACASVLIVGIGSDSLLVRGVERATAVSIGCGMALLLQIATYPIIQRVIGESTQPQARTTRLKMEPMPPMFLPGVENAPEPSGYLDAIEAMRAAGQEYPQIWHLFAFRPKPPSTWRASPRRLCAGPRRSVPASRELIAAFTSYRNDCPF